MRHLDLFSGIGGFALAARWAGLTTIGFVELNKFCQGKLRKNFPGVPIHEDIKDFRHTGPVDILSAGIPCQPFSCAGKRRGEKDDRFLWPECFRVIRECQPTWTIIENVAGFASLGLDRAVSDLEEIGYEVGAYLIPAAGVGAPHRRDRVWLVARAAGVGAVPGMRGILVSHSPGPRSRVHVSDDRRVGSGPVRVAARIRRKPEHTASSVGAESGCEYLKMHRERCSPNARTAGEGYEFL